MSKKRIPIEAQVDPALAEIVLDPWRLKQVMVPPSSSRRSAAPVSPRSNPLTPT